MVWPSKLADASSFGAHIISPASASQRYSRNRLSSGVVRRSSRANLFYVMPSVHPVKLSPLPRRERPQYRMVEYSSPRPVAGFALRDQIIHLLDPGTDLRHNLGGGHAFWNGALGRFSAVGKVAQSGHNRDSCPLL